ncbi:hypothetical protein [uncultured Aquimarina sp.]|uniref:hypothetical protein n=1 Tax=uncultured Aquimarina sp. TaxID=575652 RepID=UPI0026090876|nr:hypothetical protein [uncultured Aquimarina sp.]
MKLILSIFFTTLFIFQTTAKPKNYIITKENKEIACELKNFDPSKIALKNLTYLDVNNNFRSIDIRNIKEIRIKNKRYMISEVDIDNTTNSLDKLCHQRRNREFIFSKKRIFLEILVDGGAILYRSNLDRIEKFFYKSTDQNTPKQLLYKKYFLNRPVFYIGSDYAAENNFYYRQLYKNVACLSKNKKMKYPKFNKPSLEKYFERFNTNQCHTK